MYTKRNYSLRDMLFWTRQETVVFFVIATVPLVVYDLFEQRWLHLPWLPIALIGTAVAFIISFQNNATYGRASGRRARSGAASSTPREPWAMMVNDFITNDFTEEPASDEPELVDQERSL